MEKLSNQHLYLYIIRHAETDYNRMNIVQGSGVDSDLNETGKRQARRLYETYGHISFNKIYCSRLKRSLQTVLPFVRDGIPFEAFEALNEVNWGIHEGNPSIGERHEFYQHLVEAWKKGRWHEKTEGGESPLEARQRIARGFSLILKNHRSGHVLICTHGRALRILLTLIFNYPLSCMEYFGHRNCCLNKIIYTGSSFIAELMNDTRHLEEIL